MDGRQRTQNVTRILPRSPNAVALEMTKNQTGQFGNNQLELPVRSSESRGKESSISGRQRSASPECIEPVPGKR